MGLSLRGFVNVRGLRRSVFSFFFLGAMSLSPQLLTAQISTYDFLSETEDHIERVTHIARAAYREFPEHFGGLAESEVISYIRGFHDAPKIMLLSELKSHGYGGSESIAQILAQYHGKNRSDLDPLDKERLEFAISELNRIEKLLKDSYFEKTSNRSEFKRPALEFIELASDLVDTGLSRQRELNLKGDEALASHYVLKRSDLTERRDFWELVALIKWLEGRYHQIVAPYVLIPGGHCGSILTQPSL